MIDRRKTKRSDANNNKMKITASKVILAAALLSGGAVAALNLSNGGERRTFLQKGAVAAAGTVGVLSGASLPQVASADDYSDYTTTDSGLKYFVTKEGDGAIPTSGQTVKTQYTGWLDGFGSEKKFDSSRDRGKPFTFKAGAGQVIRGWDESFTSMKVGERRNIIIPPRLGYGDKGAGGVIPGGATLYFDVELLNIL